MPRWTPESRAEQAIRAARNKPWLNSTGPKTAKGKKAAAQNAFKNGRHSQYTKDVRKALYLQRQFMKYALSILLAKNELNKNP